MKNQANVAPVAPVFADALNVAIESVNHAEHTLVNAKRADDAAASALVTLYDLVTVVIDGKRVLPYDNKKDVRTQFIAGMSERYDTSKAAAERAHDRLFKTLGYTVLKANGDTAEKAAEKAAAEYAAAVAKVNALQEKTAAEKRAPSPSELAEVGKAAKVMTDYESKRQKAIENDAKKAESAAKKSAKDAVIKAATANDDTVRFVSWAIENRDLLESLRQGKASITKKRAAAGN